MPVRPRLWGAADHDVLPDREPWEQTQVLEGAGDAAPGHGVRREGEQVLVLGPYRSRIRGAAPGEAVEQGGLAGSVRSDEPHGGARLDGERDTVECRDPAEAHADTVDREHE